MKSIDSFLALRISLILGGSTYLSCFACLDQFTATQAIWITFATAYCYLGLLTWFIALRVAGPPPFHGIDVLIVFSIFFIFWPIGLTMIFEILTPYNDTSNYRLNSMMSDLAKEITYIRSKRSE